MTDGTALRHDLADRLGKVPGVTAAVLGGSRVRGDADPNSDTDLGILYHPDQPPDVQVLHALTCEIDDRRLPDLATPYRAWGPWITGGAWLIAHGKRVDWIYRDVALLWAVIDECRAGRPVLDYQPGHPHGFHSHIYLGEVHHCVPLYDSFGVMAELKARVAEYPPALRTSLIDRYLWEAHFTLDTAGSAAVRGDVYYVSGCLFRCVASLIQVLYAINERYFTNEKGSVRAASRFPRCPNGFGGVVTSVLAASGDGPAELSQSLASLAALTQAIENIHAGD